MKTAKAHCATPTGTDVHEFLDMPNRTPISARIDRLRLIRHRAAAQKAKKFREAQNDR